MAKYLNFTVAETSGRTFEIPMDKVKEILEYMKQDEYLAEEIAQIDLEDSYQVANFFMNFGLDEISRYEFGNDYFDLTLAEHKFLEIKENK